MKTFKSFFILFLASLFILSVNSCKKSGSEEELGPHNKVRTAQGFDEYITAQGANLQLLDFRAEADFIAGHIPNAVNIPATVVNTASDNGEFAQQVLQRFDKTRPLFIYGGSDLNLEYIVPGRISKIGFGQPNTYILLGGFNVWKTEFPGKIETGK